MDKREILNKIFHHYEMVDSFESIINEQKQQIKESKKKIKINKRFLRFNKRKVKELEKLLKK